MPKAGRPDGPSGPLEVWAGVECSHLRIHGEVRDQLWETGYATRAEGTDLLLGLGAQAVRVPVLWGRGPAHEATDWDWADRVLGRLREAGVRPVVGLLHHGAGRSGSFLDAEFPSRFGAYAGEVARRYPWVRTFLPINEPLTTARFSGLYGLWEPHVRDHEQFAAILLAQMLALRSAAQAIRSVRPDAVIVLNEDAGITTGTSETRRAVAFDNERRWLATDLALGVVDGSHPLWPYLSGNLMARRALDLLRSDAVMPDILGIDLYLTSDRFLDHEMDRYPIRSHGGDGVIRYADVDRVRVGAAYEDPFTRAIRETWERYTRPMVLAEVHLAGPAEDQIAWWHQAWTAASRACTVGIDVRAVTAWAAFGSVDWDTLLCRRQGHYALGAFGGPGASVERTALGDAVAHTALTGMAPVSSRSGWWTAPERVGVSDALGSWRPTGSWVGEIHRDADSWPPPRTPPFHPED